ncbi:unnamed protein product [Blepharisma stoltei]|uniref:FCP1 homology domain-containing protein n=1 Tax=Blepharisma stoltei TaxID=1481888 RepID=A0AAU9JUP5_9CILI|nr:unnamed protein product [Blepharisma stoltei]
MQVHNTPKYFSLGLKNKPQKLSKLTIELPETDDSLPESPKVQSCKVSKRSPSHRLIGFSRPKAMSKTPKSSHPPSAKAKISHSTSSTPIGTLKSFRFPATTRNADLNKTPLPIKSVSAKNLLKPRINLIKKKLKPRLISSSTFKKMSQGLNKTQKTEKVPETGSSPNLSSVITQLKSSQPYEANQSDEDEIEITNELWYKEHLFNTFQGLHLVQMFPPADLKMIKEKQLIIPRRKGYETTKTVIFDLDETLVHCSDNFENSDAILPITLPSGESIDIGINIRPYAIECLKAANKHSEIFVFTASHRCYADVVLDFLDPNNELIHHRFYRENCLEVGKALIKDLRIFNRKLKDTVIVDNSVYAFGYQLDNGIPIISWHNNKHDKELFNLIDYLEALSKVEDVRAVNRHVFHLRTFYEDYIKEYNL